MSEIDLNISKNAITRLSHDLAGVMGAVASSLSLLGELGGCDEETLSLASNNADILLARLRFFRAAYGNDGPLTDIGVSQQMLEDYLKSIENRVASFKVIWDCDAEIPLYFFRLILLSAQIVSESMIRGGTITIKAKAGEKKLIVVGEGQTIKTEEGLAQILSGDLSKMNPKLASAVFVQILTSQSGVKCELEKTQTSIALEFSAR
ncbi:MAG: histidine phosphotransferase family protein [Alphaproteobacteria bacterium]|nr:histidine phosphotransferase family protein [Alphaproteobacteria bacterium]